MLYFANRFLELSDKRKQETDKFDKRESAKAELEAGIIAKAEGGCNEQTVEI